MIISREWAMPSKWTFSVPAFRELIDRYLTEGWIDPFAGENSPADVTNGNAPDGRAGVSLLVA